MICSLPSFSASPESVILANRLREEISQTGRPLPFSRFMERSLYEPNLGYYERTPKNIGRTGDFYTSVSVGPLFGDLVAFHIGPYLERLGSSDSVRIVEIGAHEGRLASDILHALDRYSGSSTLDFRYLIIEPSKTRRAWQALTLEPFQGRVEWQESLPDSLHGVILSNELLDAFPVERWRWSAAQRRWIQLGVDWDGTSFHWANLQTQAPAHWDLPDSLTQILPDGFVREDNPTARRWWNQAAQSLKAGLLLTCDYGSTPDALLDPYRPQGSLRGYRRHQHVESLLETPGDIDLTANVDFSSLRLVGEHAGLNTVFNDFQRNFLMTIFAQTVNKSDLFGPWTAARTKAFQTLTHPQHLGHAFRTLIQERRI